LYIGVPAVVSFLVGTLEQDVLVEFGDEVAPQIIAWGESPGHGDAIESFFLGNPAYSRADVPII
jgi:hypothetical protein